MISDSETPLKSKLVVVNNLDSETKGSDMFVSISSIDLR